MKSNIVIQKEEGMPPGGDMFATPAGLEAFNTRRTELFQKMLDDPKLTSQLSDTSIYKLAGSRAKAELNHDWYWRNAGEVQARNVETRAGMNDAERRAIPPWETQSVPDAEQHFPAGKPAFQPVFALARDPKRIEMARILRTTCRKAWPCVTWTDKSGSFRTPDRFWCGGAPRVDIPLQDMAIKKIPEVGSPIALGRMISSPRLFKDNSERGLLDTQLFYGMTCSNVKSRIADDGTFQISTDAIKSDRGIKTNLSKLISYKLNQMSGFAAPVRHGLSNNLQSINDTIDSVKAGINSGDISPYTGLIISAI